MIPVYAYVIPFVLAVLNRACGDDTWMQSLKLPGRPLYYVAPVVAGLAWLIHPWMIALAIGFMFLVWRLPAWGRWFDLGRLPAPTDKASPFEKVIESVSFGSDHLAFAIRNLLMLAPGIVVLLLIKQWAWYVPLVPMVFAILIVAAYELAWRVRPKNPIIVAELIVGFLWGVLILGA